MLFYINFFQLSWKSTIKRLLFAFFVAIMAVITIVAIGISLNTSFELFMYALIIAVIALTSCYFSLNFIRKNKSKLNHRVHSWSIKLGLFYYFDLLMVFVAFATGNSRVKYPLHTEFLIFCGFIAFTFFMTVLPVIVYKKFPRTWIAFLPVLIIYIAIICIYVI